MSQSRSQQKVHQKANKTNAASQKQVYKGANKTNKTSHESCIAIQESQRPGEPRIQESQRR